MKATRFLSITGGAALLLATALLAACSDDEDSKPLEALTQSGITLTSCGVDSLSFEWEAVDNVSEYGIQLKDSTGKAIEGGVTTELSATYTGLDDDTKYIFEVTPFAAYNSDTYRNGAAKSITVSTAKILPLPAPTPTAANEYEKITVTWDTIEHADTFYVKVEASDGTASIDTITAYSYTFTGTVGLTYTVSVSANSSNKAYSQSEWASVGGIAPTKTPRTEIWRVNGTFVDNDITQRTYDRTLVAYDDGSFALLDFIYEGSGYDLEFKVNADGSLDIINGELETQWGIPVLCYDNYRCYIYSGPEYSSFDMKAGKMSFYSYSYLGGTNTFTWNPDDVTVQWYVVGTMYDSTVYGTKEAKSESRATLISYKDGSYKIPAWLGAEGYDLDFIPQDDGTLKITNTEYDWGYAYSVEFYPGGYWTYIYSSAGNWELNLDGCEFWAGGYYNSYGFYEFKWNASDVVKY